MERPTKYPSTPHWPSSLKVHRDDTYSQYPKNFIGKRIIITEKLDGGNTCLFNGQVYARSVVQPSNDGWFAMVKKHHAWKSNYPYCEDVAFYGEDVYGAVFDEFTRSKQESWYALRSTLTATKAKCKFIGNYKGNSNWGHQLSLKAETDTNYQYFKVTAYDYDNLKYLF